MKRRTALRFLTVIVGGVSAGLLCDDRIFDARSLGEFKSNRASCAWSDNCRSGRSYSSRWGFRGSVRYGFQFFIDLRLEHFKQLNEVIFKPLSELKLQQNGRQLSLHIPNDDMLWKSAVKHMLTGDKIRQDMPKFIEDLEKKIHDHNLGIPFVKTRGGVSEVNIDDVDANIVPLREMLSGCGATCCLYQNLFSTDTTTQRLIVAQHYSARSDIIGSPRFWF